MDYNKALSSLADMLVYYKDKKAFFADQVNANVVKIEYARNYGLHRGYYCPSLVIDIIIGNTRRGRIISKNIAHCESYYKYYLDNLGCLIAAQILNSKFNPQNFDNKDYNTEYIFWDNDIELGVFFDPFNQISSLSRCEYINRHLMQYAFALCLESNIYQLTIEEYDYNNGQLNSMDMHDLHPGSGILRHNKYIFDHDNEGYLSTYEVIEYEGERIKSGCWDGHKFKVNKKIKL